MTEQTSTLLSEAVAVPIPVAARLLNLSRVTVMRLVKSGDIPATQVGKRFYIPTAYLRSVAEQGSGQDAS